MRPGAAPEDVDAVVARVEQAGGSAFISRGIHRTIVGLVGDVVAFQGLNLRAMPGVVDVVRVSKPYKLVSREHHPDASVVTVGERGDVHIGPDTFVLIAGPCAVETPEQTFAAADMASAPARRCCAAARTSRGPRRTPSRGSARRAWRSSPRRASAPACRRHRGRRPQGRRGRRAVRRHAADRHPQHAELPAAAGRRARCASR
jgi:hypothetical protein